MILNEEHKFIFVHVPKNAGTSVRKMLRTHSGTRPSLVSSDTKHETYSEFRARWTERSGRPVEDLDEYRVVAIIRNPWDRFLSLHRYLQGRVPWVAEDVDAFASQVTAIEDWTRSIRSLRSQSSFVEGVPGDLRICRFESLKADLAVAFGDYALDLPSLGRRNATRSRPEPGGIRRLLGALAPPRYRSEMSPRTAGIVSDLYAEDIARFGYRF